MKTIQQQSQNRANPELQPQSGRRKLLTCLGIGGLVAATVPTQWSRPLVDSVLLPAHAVTSCVGNTQVGGPLIGNRYGALTCQAACEAEATVANAELCEVTESMDAADAVQCLCDLKTP